MAEATRVAQSKYEETLETLTNQMVSLNTGGDMDEDHLQELLKFVDSELAYHESAVRQLEDLKSELSS
jgi:CRISPR/Cas system CSM-associated protein Csm2 small subunit